MNNVPPIRKTRRVTVTAHRVAFDMVPRHVVEELFHAAIAVGWAADDDAYFASDNEYRARLKALQAVVGEASQYTTPIEHEVDEPIGPV